MLNVLYAANFLVFIVMLSLITLNAIMLNAVYTECPFFIVMSAIIQNVNHAEWRISIVMLSGIMLNVLKLSVFMLNVVILSVVLLIVLAPI
jgi:hypothetical protein